MAVVKVIVFVQVHKTIMGARLFLGDVSVVAMGQGNREIP